MMGGFRLTFLKSKKSIRRFVSARPTRDPDDDAGSNEPEGLEREDDDDQVDEMPPKKSGAGGAGGGKKSAKQVLKEQREALKAQLANIETSLEATAKHRLDSLFDAAIGLELWLQANSKAFPADAVKQKVERLREIATLCVENKLDADEAYWELAGLYGIVHRESSRKELKLERPTFIFPQHELPCLPPNDALSVEEIEEALGFPMSELDERIAELEQLEEAQKRAEAAAAEAEAEAE
jgi:hypothetical protein